MSYRHDLAPDLGRQSAANSLVHGLAAVIAYPNTGREMGRIANKPGVAEILTGARLAGGRVQGNSCAASRSTDERGVQHIVHGADVHGIDNLCRARCFAGKEHPARTHTHAPDGVRLDRRTAISENAVGASQFQQRNL